MKLLEETIKNIRPIDNEIMKRAQEKLDDLTKPKGSLGRLEELARQVVGITGDMAPGFKRKVIFTMAADHGVAKEGVSLYPQEVTAQMVANFLSGGAGINVLARHVGAQVIVVDMGVAVKVHGPWSIVHGFKNRKIGFGTKNMAEGPAMTKEEAIRAVEAGIEVFEEEFAGKRIDIIGTGDMGIANTTAASAIAAAITGRPPSEITGRGTGIGDAQLELKTKVIEKALKLNAPDGNDALDVLSKVGGFEIGGICGLILAASRRRVPVAVDGFISGAAALLSYKLAPVSRDYMFASHRSQEKGHAVILGYMGLKPVLDLDMRLGEGTGAALAINVIEAGIKLFNEMATFSQAKVSKESQSSKRKAKN